MIGDEWIDVRDRLPENKVICAVVLRDRTFRIAYRWRPCGCDPRWKETGDNKQALDVILYLPLPDQPPRRPFKLIDSDNGPAILHGNKTYAVAQWTRHWPMGGLVDWLNEMVLRGENDER